MVDRRVVVHEPLPIGKIEPVEGALDAFTAQNRDDVGAGQGAAEADRMRRIPGAARGPHVDRAHVIRRSALVLQRVVIECRVLAKIDFRDGIREVLRPSRPRVGLHDGCLTAGAEDDEHAGMDHRRPALGLGGVRGDKQQMNRLLQDRAGRKLNAGSVVQECRVERDKGMLLEGGDAREVRVDLVAARG